MIEYPFDFFFSLILIINHKKRERKSRANKEGLTPIHTCAHSYKHTLEVRKKEKEKEKNQVERFFDV